MCQFQGHASHVYWYTVVSVVPFTPSFIPFNSRAASPSMKCDHHSFLRNERLSYHSINRCSVLSVSNNVVSGFFLPALYYASLLEICACFDY